MFRTRKNIKRKSYDEGFTLIELITVIAIMVIISAVLVPSFLGITRRVRKRVCDINSLRCEEMYELYLCEKERDHSKTMFDRYVKEQGKDICPDGGAITYRDGKVGCGTHQEGNDKDDDKGDVPYL